nr:MAG TPA: hypothetical protein [Caudoviricetes sp.]
MLLIENAGENRRIIENYGENWRITEKNREL